MDSLNWLVLHTGGGSFFGDAWWIFPLVGICMMLVMMGGMMFMMLMMRGRGGMGGMWSQGPADEPPKRASDQTSEAELVSLRREVADLQRRLEPESAQRARR